MSGPKDLEYARGTHAHRRALYRFSHLRRFHKAVELLDCRPESHVLDYGSGDGYLLELLSEYVPRVNLTALEPLPYLQDEIGARFSTNPVRVVVASADIPDHSVDRIACLEVLEHLQPEDVSRTLCELERLLAVGGVLVVSVPIEIGPSILLKYGVSLLLTGSDRRFTFREVVRATLGLSIPRDTNARFIPHKGFDYRRLRMQIQDRFVITRETFSPVPIFCGVANSQVTWKLIAADDSNRRKHVPSSRTKR